jgi:Flp pilus assembly pilin Flp
MRIVRNLIHDEGGAEVMEYALVAGLIAIAAVIAILSVGQKVLARWQVVERGIQ